jgi:hypothetical protein
MSTENPVLGAEADRLLSGMAADGVPLGRVAILDVVEHPHWSAATRARDWRSHVPPSLRGDWDVLPLIARLCVFETAELAALSEDAGASMVTGSGGADGAV